MSGRKITESSSITTQKGGDLAVSARSRLPSIDRLRGLVMVLMVLDHAWFYFSQARFNPTNPYFVYPAETDLDFTAAFFTSWLPKFCAPVFVLLVGVGTYLQQARGKPLKELAMFLLTRGLWLVLLDLTVIRWLVYFCFQYDLVDPLIFWAIGWSMVVFSGLVLLPSRWVGAIGAAILLGHNLLSDGLIYQFPAELPNLLWTWLYQPATIVSGVHVRALMLQPVLPWIGVMALGYALGELMLLDAPRRRRSIFTVGLCMTAAFIALRFTNQAAPIPVTFRPSLHGYGDPWPWYAFDVPINTLISFLKCTSPPASLAFLLMTLGPSLMLLAWFDHDRPRSFVGGRIEGWLTTLGRVPLLYYLLQWLFLHLFALLLALLAGNPTEWLFNTLNWEVGRPFGWSKQCGFSLWVVYVMWISTVVAAYPICRWYAGVKQRNKWWWLTYI